MHAVRKQHNGNTVYGKYFAERDSRGDTQAITLHRVHTTFAIKSHKLYESMSDFGASRQNNTAPTLMHTTSRVKPAVVVAEGEKPNGPELMESQGSSCVPTSKRWVLNETLRLHNDFLHTMGSFLFSPLKPIHSITSRYL